MVKRSLWSWWLILVSCINFYLWLRFIHIIYLNSTFSENPWWCSLPSLFWDILNVNPPLMTFYLALSSRGWFWIMVQLPKIQQLSKRYVNEKEKINEKIQNHNCWYLKYLVKVFVMNIRHECIWMVVLTVSFVLTTKYVKNLMSSLNMFIGILRKRPLNPLKKLTYFWENINYCTFLTCICSI